MNPEILQIGRISYADALAMQNEAVDALLAGVGAEKLFLLEHEPVYTIGRTRDRSSLRDPAALGHPVVETNRGGQATYHGPGQLVGYPILNLNRRGRDLHKYLRLLEQVLIDLCAEYGVEAGRQDGLTGVWIHRKKIASLGVGVRKWVTMHGFAFNVLASSLDPFREITPCGIQDVRMTSLDREVGGSVDLQAVTTRFGELFVERLPGL